MLTKIWHPFNLAYHARLKCVIPCLKDDTYLVTQRLRDADGHILAEQQLEGGRPMTGIETMLLDYRGFAGDLSRARTGLIETEVASGVKIPTEPVLSYMGPNTFSSVIYAPPPVVNEGRRDYRYRGFSFHPTFDWIADSGLLLINISTDPKFSRSAHVNYQTVDRQGQQLTSGSVTVPPFGTRWLGLEWTAVQDRGAVVTMFSDSDGPALLSFLYAVSRDDSFSIDHTVQPLSQRAYGEDVSTDIRHRYQRWRTRVTTALRYRLHRVDRRRLLRIP
jgi:hypothetical protein